MSPASDQSSQGLKVTTKSDQVYKTLTSDLSSRAGKIFEFEVLPKDFLLPAGHSSPILVEDNSIAILKHALISATVYAIKLFFSLVSRGVLLKDGPLSSQGTKAFEASAIILLFDPEHLTAVNFRKRFILSLQNGYDLGPDRITLSYSEAITYELAFVESLQTSPLHRHTKSPTLWSHRKWLKKQEFLSIPIDSRKMKEAASSDILVEFSIVKKSGERHPKNYYAWTYARWLSKQSENFSLASPSKSASELTQELVAQVSDWCLKNPTDISGWSFLLFVLRDRNDGSPRPFGCLSEQS
jgi:protein prenyltransferase alpha subunit repeat containing protein 1